MIYKEIKHRSKKYQDLVIKVDAGDFDFVNKYKWYITKNKENFIVFSSYRYNGNKITVFMSRLLLNVTDKSLTVDHIDNDTLNNCRDNLRIATYQQNGCNKKKRNKLASSNYKGVHAQTTVSKGKTFKYWRARIVVNYKKKSLGLFKTELEAALAYNEAAIKYHGEFANINKI